MHLTLTVEIIMLCYAFRYGSCLYLVHSFSGNAADSSNPVPRQETIRKKFMLSEKDIHIYIYM